MVLLRRGSGVRHPITLLSSELTSSAQPSGTKEMLLEDIEVWIKTDSSQRLAEYKRMLDTIGRREELYNILGLDHAPKALPTRFTVLFMARRRVKGKWSSINTGEGRRRFLFSKLQLTDEEHFMSDGFGQYRPQAIKVKITWIKGFKKIYLQDDAEVRRVAVHKDSIRGPSTSEPATYRMHEQLVIKGHDGSAQLGPLLPTNTTIPVIIQDKRPFRWDYTESDRQALFFIFHYAPSEWLQAKDIVSRRTIILPTILCGTNEQSSQKRAQDPTSPENFQQELEKPEETKKMDKQECLKGQSRSASTPAELRTSLKRQIPPAADLTEVARDTNIYGIAALSTKRLREWSPPDVVEEALVSSDEEIVLLGFKSSRPQARKRPRFEMNRKELEAESGISEVDPEPLSQQEIDLWRLGC
ncbi:hypothetical protein RhiJN_05592 [Ceratobasidium sp. AG-Ba]|nr:hypothetical protein RhiJN_05592 [Ceratobasidium sp. AG-Ba]